jgi:hypothetical protein
VHAVLSCVAVLAATLLVGAHPAVVSRAGRALATVRRHVRPGIDPANILSAIPIILGGLGVIEVTQVAITVGFGTPRPTAVLAVLGYWL